jgi:hypothetical protein
MHRTSQTSVWMAAIAAVLLSATPSCAQMLNSDFHFVPANQPHFNDLRGDGSSPTYLFSPAARSFKLNPSLEFKMPWNADQHTFLVGPEIHAFLTRRLTLNAWMHGGVAKEFAFFSPLTQPTDATPPRFGLPSTPASNPLFIGANAWAASYGGALDYRFRYGTLRILQLDTLLMQVKGTTIRDRRATTGVRFSFGK